LTGSKAEILDDTGGPTADVYDDLVAILGEDIRSKALPVFL
jgi:hypothetical protein